jgi:hypothetical protein
MQCEHCEHLLIFNRPPHCNGFAVPAYQIHVGHHALRDESREEFSENNYWDKRYYQSNTIRKLG